MAEWPAENSDPWHEQLKAYIDQFLRWLAVEGGTPGYMFRNPDDSGRTFLAINGSDPDDGQRWVDVYLGDGDTGQYIFGAYYDGTNTQFYPGNGVVLQAGVPTQRPIGIGGNGPPHGQTVAGYAMDSQPNGTRYIDEAATYGAVEWVRNTNVPGGWNVVEGDTYWYVVDLDFSGSMFESSDGDVRIRRVGNRCTLKGSARPKAEFAEPGYNYNIDTYEILPSGIMTSDGWGFYSTVGTPNELPLAGHARLDVPLSSYFHPGFPLLTPGGLQVSMEPLDLEPTPDDRINFLFEWDCKPGTWPDEADVALVTGA